MTEVWQARIGCELAAQLRTDIVRTALQLLHRRAAEERMAHSVDTFYGDATSPLPIGVLPDDA